MGLKRHGVKCLLKHDGILVEKVMTKPQFEAFVKSSILDQPGSPWFLLGHRECMIDKYGNMVVNADAIEEYHGFEKEKSDPVNHDDYFMDNTDLMEVIKIHQTMDTPKTTTPPPRKKLVFAAPIKTDEC